MIYLDGAAYPVVLLGFALRTSPTFDAGLSWTFAASVVWGIASARGIGCAFGAGVVNLATRLRTRYEKTLRLEGFSALGLIARSYGYGSSLYLPRT